MRRLVVLFFIFVSISCTDVKKDALTGSQQQELQTYYQNKQYFDLRDNLQQYRGISSVMLSFFRGLSDNKFNMLDASIGHLNTFIRHWKDGMNDSLLIDAYKTLGDGYSKTFQYRKAAEIYRKILEKFEDQLDTEHIKDIRNYVRMFSALTEVPPQTIEIHGNTEIQSVDGGYLPLRINGHDMRLGPDTGADYSCIIRSLAERVQMRIVNADANILNVAGQTVKADFGVASELEIGHAVLRNVVFLVFEDKDLFIPEADFQIKGVIGFPVFAMLKEVCFHRDGVFSVPEKPRRFADQNMCLDELQPMIAGFYKGHRHTFCLDTGAGKSILYPPFLKIYEDVLKRDYPLESERVQGFGGYREIPAYIMQDVIISFAGKESVFHELPVLTDFTTDKSRYFFGNIGRDLLDQFDIMTLNFVSMHVEFERFSPP